MEKQIRSFAFWEKLGLDNFVSRSTDLQQMTYFTLHSPPPSKLEELPPSLCLLMYCAAMQQLAWLFVCTQSLSRYADLPPAPNFTLIDKKFHQGLPNPLDKCTLFHNQGNIKTVRANIKTAGETEMKNCCLNNVLVPKDFFFMVKIKQIERQFISPTLYFMGCPPLFTIPSTISVVHLNKQRNKKNRGPGICSRVYFWCLCTFVLYFAQDCDCISNLVTIL